MTLSAMLKEQSKDTLKTQVLRQANSILDESGSFVVRELETYEQSIVNVLSFATENVLSSAYNASLTEVTYYDDGNSASLAQPLGFDPSISRTYGSHGNESVSLEASSFFITSTSRSEYGAVITPTMAHIRNRTANIDPFFKDMYNRSSSIYGMYLGFGTSTSLFRRYPGRNTFLDNPEYDPSGRPWYTAAVARPDTAVFTAPYVDAHGAGWMITAARAIYDPDVKVPTIIGVAGVDLLITDMKELVDSITFLKSGKVALIDVPSGQVVTDRDWDLNSKSFVSSCAPDTGSSPDPFMYCDLKPKIKEQQWESIKLLQSGATINFEAKGAGIYATRLNLFDGQYVLLAFVPLSEIFEPLSDTLRQNNDDSSVAIGVVVVVCLAVGILAYLSMRAVLSVVLKNFVDMERNVEQLLQNVGKSDLGYGMVVLNEGASTEIAAMQDSLNDLIDNIRSNREVSVNEVSSGQTMMNTLATLLPAGTLVVEDNFSDMPQPSAPPLAAWAVPVVDASNVHAVGEIW